MLMFCRFVKSSNQRFIFTTLPRNKYIHTHDTAVVKIFFFKRAKSEKLIFECNLASSSLHVAARKFPDPLPFEMKRFILKKRFEIRNEETLPSQNNRQLVCLEVKKKKHTVTLFFFSFNSQSNQSWPGFIHWRLKLQIPS